MVGIGMAVAPVFVPSRTLADVGVHKVSVSLEDDAYEAARAAARAEGMSLSAWLSRAAAHEARIQNGLRAVAEFEAEHGPLSEEELRKADGILDRLGVGRGAPAQ
jgi:hypothetical protein